MNEKPTVYFLIPVLNEALNIERLFSSLQELWRNYEPRFIIRFILIDDGSTDGTREEILKYSRSFQLDCEILSHPKNLGPGKAFQTAFLYIAPLLSDMDWIVTMEGDNTSRVELLNQMFERAKEGYEVIFASPYAYGGAVLNTSSIRVILSNIANTFVKEFLGVQGIFTVSSFFRLYRATALKRLQQVYGAQILEKDGFECMLEMLMKMIDLKMSISEVPMVLDTKRRLGKSKMKIVKTILAYFSLWSYKRKWMNMAKGIT